MMCPNCTRGDLLILRVSKGPDFDVHVTQCDVCDIKYVYPATQQGVAKMEFALKKQRLLIERGYE